MPIVKSANPSPTKFNASLNPSEDFLSKPSEEIIATLDFIVSDSFVNESRDSSEEIPDSLFYYKRGKPTISLNDYMKRIRHFTECSNEILVISLIYMERILEKHHFNKEKMNFHKWVVYRFAFFSNFFLNKDWLFCLCWLPSNIKRMTSTPTPITHALVAWKETICSIWSSNSWNSLTSICSLEKTCFVALLKRFTPQMRREVRKSAYKNLIFFLFGNKIIIRWMINNFICDVFYFLELPYKTLSFLKYPNFFWTIFFFSVFWIFVSNPNFCFYTFDFKKENVSLSKF